MDITRLIVGGTLFIFGVLMINIGITDVSHDIEAILSLMVFLAGVMLIATSFGK